MQREHHYLGEVGISMCVGIYLALAFLEERIRACN
jgi:hypothetical protein